MDSIRYIATILVMLSVLFPVIYALKYNIDNKFLFIFSVFGGEIIIHVLLAGAALPIIILSIYMFPQLETYGIHLTPLNYSIRFVNEYWFYSTPFILVILSLLISRRYEAIFMLNKSYNKSINTDNLFNGQKRPIE